MTSRKASSTTIRPWPRPHATFQRMNLITVERRFNSGFRKLTQHHSVQLPPPTHGYLARWLAKRSHERSHQPIALLPIDAGHVERDFRPVAKRGAPLKLDERTGGRNLARRDLYPLPVRRCTSGLRRWESATVRPPRRPETAPRRIGVLRVNLAHVDCGSSVQPCRLEDER